MSSRIMIGNKELPIPPLIIKNEADAYETKLRKNSLIYQ